MEFPPVNARLDNAGHAYLLKRYRIVFERQRPTYLEGEIEEPIASGKLAVLSMGFANTLNFAAGLQILECHERQPEEFDIAGVEPLRHFLDAPVKAQYIRQTAAETLKRLLASVRPEAKFVDKTGGTLTRKCNPIFFSTVRAALDQIALMYGFNKERWKYAFEPEGEKFVLLPGDSQIEPIELPVEMFYEEDEEKGIEFKQIPHLRPYLPVQWRDETKTIDKIEFNSRSNSMFLRLV